MPKFESLSIVLPSLEETFSFIQTVDIILNGVDNKDIKEFLAVVCDRTTKDSLAAIEECRVKAEKVGIPVRLVWQTTPFAGGAYHDGLMAATASHTVLMSPDLNTDPTRLPALVEAQKQHPNDIISASRWIPGGGFEGYNPVKKVWNLLAQKWLAIFYNVNLTDFTFGYHVGPTEIWQSIRWEELKHPFFLEETLKPLRLGVKIHEVPAYFLAREEGGSVNPFIANFKYLGIAFRVRFMRRDDILLSDEAKKTAIPTQHNL